MSSRPPIASRTVLILSILLVAMIVGAVVANYHPPGYVANTTSSGNVSSLSGSPSSQASSTSSITSSSTAETIAQSTTETTGSTCEVGQYTPATVAPSNGTLSFYIVSATGEYNSSSSETTVMVQVSNTGSLPIKLEGIRGVPPPPGTSYVCNSFTRTFYSASGKVLNQQKPPQTQNGGWFVVKYLVVGARPGEALTVTCTIIENNQAVSVKSTFIVRGS